MDSIMPTKTENPDAPKSSSRGVSEEPAASPGRGRKGGPIIDPRTGKPADPSAQPPKILVVDDEARIREACRAVLEEAGFAVVLAKDGAEGLGCIEKAHYDIVLLDLMMPSLSGFEVLSKVKILYPETVIIVITGYATVEHSIEAMKSGAFDFIPKPFSPDQLRVTVLKAIDAIHRTRPASEIFSLSTLVEESLGLIRDQKRFMNITIERQMADESLVICADRNQMRQVVINLIINALDAMAQKGRLTLRTFAAPDGKTAVLEVADTGKGIAASDRSRVFDPFFTTKELGRGNGLGLTTACDIVRKNRGTVRIRETGPEGTTFRVEMPLADPAKKGAPAAIG